MNNQENNPWITLFPKVRNPCDPHRWRNKYPHPKKSYHFNFENSNQVSFQRTLMYKSP